MVNSKKNEFELARTLGDIVSCWRQLTDREAKKFGLSRPQWRLLSMITYFIEYRGIQPTQKELASSIDMDPGMLTRVLDSLEQSELVIRQACSEDRRAKKITLAPKAKEAVNCIYASHSKIERVLKKEFSDDENAKLLSQLQLIFEKIKQM